MDDAMESGNAFAVPDMWQKSPGCRYLQTNISGISAESELDNDSLVFQPITATLPPLDISSGDPLQTFKSRGTDQQGTPLFSYGPLEGIDSLEQSSISSDPDSHHEEFEDVLGDLWSAKEIYELKAPQFEIKSWERFYDRSFREPCNAYISGAGPRVFDAALEYGVENNLEDASECKQGVILRSGAVLSSLIHLALGRESVLFRYDAKERKFRGVVETIRISGYTLESINSVMAAIISYGSQLRRIKDIVTDVLSSKNVTTSMSTLASAIDVLLSALEAQLAEPLASTQTVLHLQAILEPSTVLLDQLSQVIEKAQTLKIEEELLSMLFDLMRNMECSRPWLQPLMNELVVYTSGPWLRSLDGFLGLRADNDQGTISAKTQLEDNPHPRMPDFIEDDFTEALLETKHSLELLQIHESDHPLARSQSLCGPPSLQWQFSWQDVEKVQAKAQQYEANILIALKEYNTSGSLSSVQATSIEQEPQASEGDTETGAFSTDIIHQINSPLSSCINPSTSTSRLSTAVVQVLNGTYPPQQPLTSLPTSLLPMLSFQPILAAQSRLVSYSTLRLLFRTHSLRDHFRLLHACPLFANGPFLVRLSHALFDPSLPSAAYQRGRVRSGNAGLQLGARGTIWPPASSELRIALMGILTEAYHGTSSIYGSMGNDKGELPGDLSFAIRNDMSDAELERCMDQDGLEALDFLKIHYRPPKPLDVVITEAVLDKYERVSRLLLRGARVGFVVKQMMRHERRTRVEGRGSGLIQRFKIEAHHFVVTVLGYIGEAVEELWTAFEKRLDGIEKSIDCYEVGRQVEGVHQLRSLHEEVLDQILAACLLRKRQELVSRLLEEILGLILEFAKVVRDGSDGSAREGGKGEVDVARLYEIFRRKVRVFITVCRGLQDQKSVAGNIGVFNGGKRGEERGNGIGRLVLRLEMNWWYMR
ncbi:MAG: hypothetical protein Q9170_006073 [Blastenia crenularia]